MARVSEPPWNPGASTYESGACGGRVEGVVWGRRGCTHSKYGVEGVVPLVWDRIIGRLYP